MEVFLALRVYRGSLTSWSPMLLKYRMLRCFNLQRWTEKLVFYYFTPLHLALGLYNLLPAIVEVQWVLLQWRSESFLWRRRLNHV
ncbi:hypothetical protein IFM89_013466 [Coptis chinensis]|uniref:Uncharacterized protein n=1 Tax=Coptis chinensis TaxID=261450 RepID=A0A835HK99_9MAGN|nr:hypothetical protein IFM89_013466 [Coptis chinensis]